VGHALMSKLAESRVGLARRLAAMAGVVTLLVLGFAPEGGLADRLGLVALVAFALAAASGWLQLLSQGRPLQPVTNEVVNRNSRAWWLVTIAVVVVAGFAVQTWVRPGTTIAGGDIVAPDGTAWIGRLFEPWTWGGSSLGEPSQLPLALPWAAVVSLVHAFGGNIEVAQRIWYTTLFVGAGLAALGLLASLRMGPMASLTGTAVYVFNPYVITWVNTFDNYLAALVVVAAIPAALIAAGTGRLSARWSAALVAATTPLIGYAFLNPPLVGMIVVVLVAPPLVVAWVEGKDAAIRCVRALLLAIPLLLVASAYWTVPAFLHLSSGIPSAFTAVSAWTWTEGRATIRNALWLNTHWGWNFTEYFPYGGSYSVLPLSLLRFALPAIAFSSLCLTQIADREHRFLRDRQLRLAVAASTVAVLVIVFSTGTNPPGDTIFMPLYNLPFGWLLREPGRFLMLVALAYAVLTAILVDALLYKLSMSDLLSERWPQLAASRFAIAPLSLGTAMLLGFPLYTGGFVPDTRPTLATWAVSARQTHVQMPAYWTEMARFADGLPVQGAVLVMPPDDWYEMPYTWYYGTDAFIVQLFKRRVLVPNTQTYTPASSGLIGAVDLTAQSILHKDWGQAETLVTVLNAPLVLVREDIQAPFPNHSIPLPHALAEALNASPNFVLVRKIGSLDLFALRSTLSETEVGTPFRTINTRTPDLRLLPLLPPNTALVSGESRAGVPKVLQAPQLEGWQAQGDTVVWRPPAPAGWTYRIGDLESRTVVPLDRAGTFVVGTSKARIDYSPDAVSNRVTVSVIGRTSISNGDFAKGIWGPLGDCHDVARAQAKPNLTATIIGNAAPGGLPVLQLSANLDTACEAQKLDWHGNPLLLSLMIHPLQGSAPRLCLWEDGPGRCAPIQALPDRPGWSAYRAAVTPEAGTTAITLYLYADGGPSGSRTVNEYADVRVVEVPALPSLALLADPEPTAASPLQLAVIHSSFSSNWQGPVKSEHVLVDGMLNGWLVPTGSHGFTASYMPTTAIRVAEWISIAGWLLIILLLTWTWVGPVAGRQLGRRFLTTLTNLADRVQPSPKPATIRPSHPPEPPLS
jgi:arabinofuranan 3-O-arabinosyltransferase